MNLPKRIVLGGQVYVRAIKDPWDDMREKRVIYDEARREENEEIEKLDRAIRKARNPEKRRLLIEKKVQILKRRNQSAPKKFKEVVEEIWKPTLTPEGQALALQIDDLTMQIKSLTTEIKSLPTPLPDTPSLPPPADDLTPEQLADYNERRKVVWDKQAKEIEDKKKLRKAREDELTEVRRKLFAQKSELKKKLDEITPKPPPKVLPPAADKPPPSPSMSIKVSKPVPMEWDEHWVVDGWKLNLHSGTSKDVPPSAIYYHDISAEKKMLEELNEEIDAINEALKNELYNARERNELTEKGHPHNEAIKEMREERLEMYKKRQDLTTHIQKTHSDRVTVEYRIGPWEQLGFAATTPYRIVGRFDNTILHDKSYRTKEQALAALKDLLGKIGKTRKTFDKVKQTVSVKIGRRVFNFDAAATKKILLVLEGGRKHLFTHGDEVYCIQRDKEPKVVHIPSHYKPSASRAVYSPKLKAFVRLIKVKDD